MPDAHKNFAYSTVATAPSPASSGTSLVVQTGDGSKFPTAPFNVTIWPSGAQPLTSNAEIARVTNVSSDTLTIVRAQESSSARSVVVGDQIGANITAKTLTDVENGLLIARAVLSGTRDYFWPGAIYSGLSNTLTTTAGTKYYFPAILTERVTVAGIAVEVFTSQAASNFRMGIYSSGTDWQPTSNIFDSGSIASTTTGKKSYTGFTGTLDPGLYLGIIQADTSGIAFRTAQASWVGPSTLNGTNVGAGSNIVRGGPWTVTGTYGALPGTGTAWTTSVDAAAPGPSLPLFLDVSAIG